MKRQVRAQSSIEFLSVTAIGLLLLTTVSFVFIRYTQGDADEARLSQVNSVGQELLSQAAFVYSRGSNSWVTVETRLPDGVQAVYTVENDTLVFDVVTKNGIVSQPIFSEIPIQGINTIGDRSYVNNGTVTIHSGLTTFRVTSHGSSVAIYAVT